MGPKLDLPKYVQCKRGKHFYFRVVGGGYERRIALPHPLGDGFKAAYNAAWYEVFGVWPEDGTPPKSVSRLVEMHRLTVGTSLTSKKSREWRVRALDLLEKTWGAFDARDIRTEHCQALYDKLADKPPTANRLFDDISKIFSWGMPRGFCETNPASGVERIRNPVSYEPWPIRDLEKLLGQGREHIARVALVALYTGQDRGDVLERFTEAHISDDVWTLRRGKTKRQTRDVIRIALHPLVLSVVDQVRAERRKRGMIDPNRPLLENSRGEPWGEGFGASWNKELKRLKLAGRTPPLTFKGLRVTNATMIADEAAKGSESAAEALSRVRAMLGHHSERMSAHYARRAQIERTNAGTVEMLPVIGKTPKS